MVALVKQQTIDGADLLSQYRASGAPEVFAQIMRAYGGMVFSVCLKVTKVPADAEDASQATFLTLAVQCKTGATINYLGPWLKKVAKRTALDLVRSRKRRTRRETVTAENRPEFFSERAGGNAENGEINQIIRHELDQLPAKYRMPLVLHYFGGLSHDQISQEMRCTTAALGVRLHRARKMLGKRLTARGINLERGALGAAIAVAIHQVITDRFVNSTQQATFAMAWAHPASAVATLPHSLGDISNLVATVAASMGRARTRMAAIAMAASITMLGGAAEAVRHLPESIRPGGIDFLSPSKAIESFFNRITLPVPRVSNDEPNRPFTTDRHAAAPVEEVPETDDVDAGYRLNAGAIAIAPPTLPTTPANQQRIFSAVIPPKNAPPPTNPPRLQSNTSKPQPASSDAGTRTIIVRDQSTNPAPIPLNKNATAAGTPSGGGGGGNGGSSSNGDSGSVSTAAPSVPPPMMIPPSTSGQHRPRVPSGHVSAPSSAQTSDKKPSYNLSPGAPIVGHFAASATDALTALPSPGPLVPDFTKHGRGSVTDSFLTDSGDVFVAPGTGTYQWQDPAQGIVFGEANSATVTFENVAVGGLMSIERLSRKTTLAPDRPDGHTFIGIWALDSSFEYDAVSLNVRYDEALAQSLGLPENILKLWVYDNDNWVRITGNTFSRNLDEHTVHGAYYGGTIDFFAVSAPEPGAIVGVLGAAAAALLRRRRRAS